MKLVKLTEISVFRCKICLIILLYLLRSSHYSSSLLPVPSLWCSVVGPDPVAWRPFSKLLIKKRKKIERFFSVFRTSKPWIRIRIRIRTRILLRCLCPLSNVHVTSLADLLIRMTSVTTFPYLLTSVPTIRSSVPTYFYFYTLSNLPQISLYILFSIII
jgi:hypothetical protein